MQKTVSPAKATRPKVPAKLARLVALTKSKEALFAAQNAYMLNQRCQEPVTDAQLLARLSPVLSAKELKVISAHLQARAAADAVMRDAQAKRQAESEAAATEALRTYGKALGDGWYEFLCRVSNRKVRAQVLGFDSCYVAVNTGSVCGSLRVSRKGNGSSEPWPFYLEKGEFVVRTRGDD